MDVSENGGTPKSSILIRFSIINHPFWGTTIFGNTQMFNSKGHLSDDHPFLANCSSGFQGWIALLHPEVLLSDTSPEKW